MSLLMDLASIQLLRKLGSGVQPDGSPVRIGAPAIETIPFRDLVRRVETGALHSGKPVELDAGAGIRLEGEQLERLGVVVDAAEAAGTKRIVALIDGEVVSIDVDERRVDGANEELVGRVVTDLDGLVIVPRQSAGELRELFGEGSRGTGARTRPGLGSVVHNAAVASLLEGIGERAGGDADGEGNARAGGPRAA